MSISVVYWSGTGNTQAMAEAIGEGIESAGAQANVISVDQASVDEYPDMLFLPETFCHSPLPELYKKLHSYLHLISSLRVMYGIRRSGTDD